jgi:chloramphenicol 3-O-phosphotransferase
MWRRLTIAGLRSLSHVRSCIVVPMTFSNLEYLQEVREGIAAGGREVRHVCLVAPLAVVHERLRRRGSHSGRSPWTWRRAAECCAAHASPAFALHVDASTRTPAEIATRILTEA